MYVKASAEPDLYIYLYNPQGMNVSEKELQRRGAQPKTQVVLRLQRSIYRLKQAGRLGDTATFRTMLCRSSTMCHRLVPPIQKRSRWKYCRRSICYDFLMTGTSKVRVDDVFKQLVTLQIKDLGVVSKFLGMRLPYFPECSYETDQNR